MLAHPSQSIEDVFSSRAGAESSYWSRNFVYPARSHTAVLTPALRLLQSSTKQGPQSPGMQARCSLLEAPFSFSNSLSPSLWRA